MNARPLYTIIKEYGSGKKESGPTFDKKRAAEKVAKSLQSYKKDVKISVKFIGHRRP